MTWDPATYLHFADLRLRPGVELISRISNLAAESIVDLGCGTGALTTLLSERWPGAAISGVDNSDEMLAVARQSNPSIEWVHADIEVWEPPTAPDVVFSNAALHWVDDHGALFQRLRSWMHPGGTIAVQMPNNWTESTHTIPARVLDSGDWPAAATRALLRNRVSGPDDYRRWLQPATVDIWETTYFQQLTGPDPVLTWGKGSFLSPVMAALPSSDAHRFEERCRTLYSEAYGADERGIVTLPFRRLFTVATAT